MHACLQFTIYLSIFIGLSYFSLVGLSESKCILLVFLQGH